MTFSIIIPTLDEERVLATTLEHLTDFECDVVVSDGGSRDSTRDIAQRHEVIWVEGPSGRGGQLNRGAAHARGDVLLFLHADTRLPREAPEVIESALQSGAIAGGFEVRFVGRLRAMRLGSWLVNRRTRLTRLPLGDQAQFVRRSAFEEVGGFQDWPILEDLDLMRRLKRIGKVAVVDPPVETSDRRYAKRGIALTMATNYLIWSLYLIGVHPRRLARLYTQVR